MLLMHVLACLSGAVAAAAASLWAGQPLWAAALLYILGGCAGVGASALLVLLMTAFGPLASRRRAADRAAAWDTILVRITR